MSCIDLLQRGRKAKLRRFTLVQTRAGGLEGEGSTFRQPGLLATHSMSLVKRLKCTLLCLMAVCLLLFIFKLDSFRQTAAFTFGTSSIGSAAITDSSNVTAATTRVSFSITTHTITTTTTTTRKPSPSTDPTFCPLKLIRDDHVPVEEYFKPKAEPVTEVVTTFLFHQPANVCSADLDILFLVASTPSKESNRDAIRQTWGSGHWPFTSNKTKMAVIFLLGRAKPWSAIKTSLEKEMAKHGDLLVVDAEDGYRQMTVKMLSGLHWVSHNCPRVRYVARVDEDHFVHVDLLYTHVHAWFQQSHHGHNAILGRLICSGESPVYRNTRTRIFVDRSSYPYAFYPGYVGGGTYVMSARLVPRLVKVARYMKSFTVDDAFITGVLTMVLNLQLVHVPQVVVVTSQDTFVSQCFFSLHKANAQVMQNIWKTLNKQPQNCTLVPYLPFQNCAEKCLPPDKKRTVAKKRNTTPKV